MSRYGWRLQIILVWIRMESDLFKPKQNECKSGLRPPYGFFKCNVDASYDQVIRQVNGGWLVRDSNGVARYWVQQI